MPDNDDEMPDVDPTTGEVLPYSPTMNDDGTPEPDGPSGDDALAAMEAALAKRQQQTLRE